MTTDTPGWRYLADLEGAVMSECKCGCGLPAPLATRTRRERGQVEGEPVRFVPGHYRKCRFCGAYDAPSALYIGASGSAQHRACAARCQRERRAKRRASALPTPEVAR